MKTKLTLLRRTMILGLTVLSSLAITQADDTTAAKAQAHLLAPAIDLFGSAAPFPQVPKIDTDSVLGLSQSFDSLLGVTYSGPMIDGVLGVTPTPGMLLSDLYPSIFGESFDSLLGAAPSLVLPLAQLYPSVFDGVAADAAIIAASR